jgi:hypothetical protein
MSNELLDVEVESDHRLGRPFYIEDAATIQLPRDAPRAHASAVRAPFHTTLVLVALAVTQVALAQPDAPRDPFVAVADADPLELGRVVRSVPDAALLARLSNDRATEIRLAAVRATPWLRAPEAALAPLAELARGRDPDLAPAAALAAVTIARALEAQTLAAREVRAQDLAPALAGLDALAEDESARDDVARAAAMSAERARAALE